MVQGSLNPNITFLGEKLLPLAWNKKITSIIYGKNLVPGSKGVLCSLRTDTQTHTKVNAPHPFRVSGICPSTYHQGSFQYVHKWMMQGFMYQSEWCKVRTLSHLTVKKCKEKIFHNGFYTYKEWYAIMISEVMGGLDVSGSAYYLKNEKNITWSVVLLYWNDLHIVWELRFLPLHHCKTLTFDITGSLTFTLTLTMSDNYSLRTHLHHGRDFVWMK